MVFSPQTSRRLLYASVGLSAFAVFKHTSISVGDLFPILDSALESDPLVAFSAKCNLLQASGTLVTMAILQLKWAQYGVIGKYDKVLLTWYGLASFAFGLGYFMKGWYLPLIPMWGIPGVVGLSQL
ncbi:hypothetical protein N431DRAFT_483340 [Stipitochalara longipes BDJ]|nr:hypothetical protein N431DRAFT_483340 [Stipitochalara longipes BDJ]